MPCPAVIYGSVMVLGIYLGFNGTFLFCKVEKCAITMCIGDMDSPDRTLSNSGMYKSNRRELTKLPQKFLIWIEMSHPPPVTHLRVAVTTVEATRTPWIQTCEAPLDSCGRHECGAKDKQMKTGGDIYEILFSL
jgi:hypothetical protein